MNEKGEKIKMIKIGFRVWHEAGNRVDDTTGRTFFGWSDKFDEVIPA